MGQWSYLFFWNVLTFLLYTNAQEPCEPINCIISEWNIWSDCTETCGEAGTRRRFKTVYQESSCGGSCTDQLEQTEPCNVRCCPRDCVYSAWTKWGLCYCDPNGCGSGGARFNCQRSRKKVKMEACGGYCDDVTVQQECGNLCCYRNCALSKWSFWGGCEAQCEQMGVKRRRRDVLQEPRCHGKRCGPLEEVHQCRGGCCPVDCVLGQWSTWSKCDVTCGQSTQSRVRFVRLAVCNGTPCHEDPVDRETRPCTRYVNTDCIVSIWSGWSDCYLDNGFCGKGVKTRSRTIEQETECEGQGCGNLTETSICYGPCCKQDCLVSEWSAWSHCSTACGHGISNRTRSIMQPPSCDGSPCIDTLLETRDCVVRDLMDCEFTPWSTWTACSTDCGVGTRARTRVLITPAYCGGQCENDATEEETECESYDARQDCKVSDWSEWDACIRNCERGDQMRNRTVLINPVCNGTVCPSEMVERRECHQKCSEYCNQGACSCKQGDRLLADNVTCVDARIKCPLPRLSYCPPNYRELEDCRHSYFRCREGYNFNKTCSAYCASDEWILKGDPNTIRCQVDGTWTQPEIFCVRPNKPPIGISVDTTSIVENRPVDSCFAYLSTITDDEASEIHTYTIVDDKTDRFYLRSNRVCLKRVPDFEESPIRWEVIFRSTDMEGLGVEEGIMFEITNANDPPSGVKLGHNTIPENSPAGTVVGCLIAQDDDPNQNINMTLVDTAGGMFATFRDDDRLCVKVVVDSDPRCQTEGGTFCSLNREIQDTYYITVLAADDGAPSMSAYYDVSITLTDVNDKQTAIKIEPSFIPEEREAGSALIRIYTIDEDTNQQYTYILLDDNNGLFEISDNNLIATRKFDYEAEIGEAFDIIIESIDDDITNPMKISKKLTIQISDINESPYELQLSAMGGAMAFELNKPKIKENINSTVIGTLSVKDPDAHDSLQIQLVGDMVVQSRFSLVDQTCTTMQNVNVYCTGKLMLNEALNYEAEDTINISISARDNQNLTTYLNLTLEVIDENDPSLKLLFDGKNAEVLEVPENLDDFDIAVLSAVDEDIADLHRFELLDSSGGHFQLDNDVFKITPYRPLDFETKQEHVIQIRCTDNGDPSMSTTFNVTVNVVDVNEAPLYTTLNSNKVPENSPENTIVGALTTTDPDNEREARQTFKYTLPGDADGRFALDGNKLIVKTSSRLCGEKLCTLDYEIEPRLYVTVLTMDSGTPRMERQDKFMIELEDTNDPPTDVKITNNVIKENEPIGSTFGTLTAYDQDGQGTLFYMLMNHQELFSIEDGNKLVTNNMFDYEYIRSYRLVVSVMDDGNPPAKTEETLVIHIIDMNEAPTIINLTDTVTIPDDVEAYSPAVIFLVTDPDFAETITISIDDKSKTFDVGNPKCVTKPTTGATECELHLIAKKMLNANEDNTNSITLMVEDRKGLTTKYAININIKDVNNAPTNILIDGVHSTELHIPENRDVSHLAVLQAVDTDVDQTHEYIILYDSSGSLHVSGNILQSEIPLNFESTFSIIGVTLEVTDSGYPTKAVNKSFDVFVDDVNEPPTHVKLSSSEIAEDSVAGTVIGNIEVEDPDVGQTFDVVLLDDIFGLFEIEDDILKIGKDPCGDGVCLLDYEKDPTINLQLLVKDDGVPQQSTVFDVQITILDVNEPPRYVKLTDNKVVEGTVNGTIIGTLTARDEDVNQHISFYLVNNMGTFDISSENNLLVKDVSVLSVGDIVYVTIMATDDGSPTASVEEKVPIIVTSDVTVEFWLTPVETEQTITAKNISVEENTDINKKIATIKFKISNQMTNLDVALRNGSEFFRADNDTCSYEELNTLCSSDLITKTLIDFEKTSEVGIIIEAVSSDGITMLEYVDVIIVDVNEPPIDIKYSHATIAVQENSRSEVLGSFSVIDPDNDDQHLFEMIGSEGLFTLNSDGQLITTANASIDYETTSLLNITVVTTDKGGLSLNKTFTVIVIDINEKPSGLDISNDKVEEMSVIGTEIGVLEVHDPDIGQNFTFTIVSGNVEKIFTIIDNKLMVAEEGQNCSIFGNTHCMLDFETKPSYNLSINVQDDGKPPMSEIFTIQFLLIDINDKPSYIRLSTTKFPENTLPGEVVAEITAYDEDVNHVLTFEVFPMDVFYVFDDTLILNKTVDFETSQSYEVIVSAMDDGNPALSASSTFLLEVIDINEPPNTLTIINTPDSDSIFVDDHPRLTENMSPGTFVAQIVALDLDTQDDLDIQMISPDLMIQNKNCIHILKGTRCTWDLLSTRRFDFEKEDDVLFEMIVTDAGGLQIRRDFSLNITDANDAPTDVHLTSGGSRLTDITLKENTMDIVIAAISVEDEETNQSHIYDVVDNTNTFFVIGNELRVTSAAKLDYEKINKFTITLTVTDNGQPPLSFDKQFIVEVTDVNEPPFYAALSNTEVAENVESGYNVGQIVIQDPDKVKTEKQSFTTTIINQDNKHFGLDGNNVIVTTPGFDQDVYNLQINITDNGIPPMSTVFNLDINIVHVNTPPVRLDFKGDESLRENLAVGTVIGQLQGRDNGVGQTLTYSIIDSTILSVIDNNVVISGPLNFEVYDHVTFTARVTDDGHPSLLLESNFTVDVNDINEPPLSIRLLEDNKMRISEGTNVNDAVAVIEVIDEDKTELYEGTIMSGGDVVKLADTGFVCGSSNLSEFKIAVTVCKVELQIATQLDYETATEPVVVTITVRDKGSLKRKQTFTFTVTNVNEPPRDLLLDSEITSIPENTGDFVVGGLSALDEDIQDTHKYQVTTHWELFTVFDNKLVLRSPLDYESKHQYVVSIRTTDNGTPRLSLTKEFILDVINVNEAPSDIQLTHTEVVVGADVGTLIGHVNVVDPDNIGDYDTLQNHTCDVSNELLRIDSTNALLVRRFIPLNVTSLDITITCHDSGEPSLSSSQDFQINIVDNVNALKGIQLVSADGQMDIAVDENVYNVTIGYLSVINLVTRMPANGSYNFSIETEEGVGLSVTDTYLNLTKPFNYEAIQWLDVSVKADGFDTNGQQVMLQKNFRIYVNDVNDPPSSVGIYGDSSIPENSPEGTIIGDLYTVDGEDYQTYTYVIQAVYKGLIISDTYQVFGVFLMDCRTLKVGNNTAVLDHENTDILTILVNSTDSGDPSLNVQSVLRIQVIDENDPPTDINISNHLVAEDSHVGYVVGTLVIEDEDVHEENVCDILNLVDVPFKVTNKVNIIVDRQLDYEADRSYNMKISCGNAVSDRASMRFTKTITLNVTNVNEPPSVITLTSTEIPEGNVIGQVIGEIKVVDLDSDNVTISLLSEGDWENFAIRGDSTLVANVELDFEKQPYHTFNIEAVDEGGLGLSTLFEIQVVDVNEEPTIITLDRTDVREDKQPGDIVAEFTTVDPDRNQIFVYTLDDETIREGTFSVDGSFLVVGRSGLDYETEDRHVIFVTSRDDGVPTLSVQASFTINIMDVNEAPTNIIINIGEAVPENAATHTVIGRVIAEDPDTMQVHSCNLNDTDYLTLVTNMNGTIEVMLLQPLNYELTPVLYLQVMCSDGEFEMFKAFRVDITNVNESPTSIKLSGSQTIRSSAEPGHVIGQLTVEDEDNDQSYTFSVIGENSDIVLVNSDSELVLKTSIPPSLLEHRVPSLRFTLTVADSGNPVLTLNQTFNILITYVDIHVYEIPKVGIDNTTINDNSLNGTVIGKLFYVGESDTTDLYISIEENFEDLFEITDDAYLVLDNDFIDTELDSIQIVMKVTDIKIQEFRLSTITLFVQRVCANDASVCSVNETCVTYNSSYSQCKCKPDFERITDNVCSVIDDCARDNDGVALCLNGGTCLDDVNSYVCKCPPGLQGEFCEIDTRMANPCEQHNCENGAICIPDSDTDTYTCSCTPGWEGSMCNVSIDDCVYGICYNDGVCVDKHLTYVCVCQPDYKGLQCEYSEDVCAEIYCNQTHVCVGLPLSIHSICVMEEVYVVELQYQLPSDRDTDEFESRLVKFIRKYGQLFSLTAPSIRKRRDVDSHEIQVYVIETERLDDDSVGFKLIVLDGNQEPFTKKAVLTALSQTCAKINSGDLSETTFCPGIQKAASRKQNNPIQHASPVGLIVGIICGVIVVVIAVAILVFIVYKKKKDNVIRPEVVESATASRRSSGYSSISKAGRPSTQTTSRNQVSQVPTTDTPTSSVFDMETVY